MIFDKLLQRIESEDIVLFFNKIFNLTYTLYANDKPAYIDRILYCLSRPEYINQSIKTYSGNFYIDVCNFFHSHKDYINFDKIHHTPSIKKVLNEYLFIPSVVYQEKDLFLLSLKFQKYSSLTLEQLFTFSNFNEEEEKQFWLNVVKYQQLSVEFIQKFYYNKMNTPELAYYLKTAPNQFFNCRGEVIMFILKLAEKYENKNFN